MALNFQMLLNKRIVEFDNEKIVELTESSIEYNDYVFIEDLIVVTDEWEGRPWLISQFYYGSQDYTDLLCFFNGVPNMFALEKGTVLFIPELTSMVKALRDNNKVDESSDLRLKYSDKLSKKDQRRIELLKDKVKDRANATESPKPPNLADLGSESIEVSSGRIVFGQNVTKGPCSDKFSDAQIKTKIIRDRIKNRILNEKV